MIRKILKEIEELFFPISCVGCETNSTWLCPSCEQKIEYFKEEICYKCGKQSNNFKVCADCKEYLDGVYILGSYKDKILKKLIWDYKYNYIKDLSEVISSLFLKNFKNNLNINFSLVPVPLYKKKLRVRGYNQSEVIAKEISRKTNIPYFNYIKRIKDTKPQMELSKILRIDNIFNAFEVTGDVGGKNIYLVDDVVTTGSTLEECSRVLKEAGANEVWALVLVRD